MRRQTPAGWALLLLLGTACATPQPPPSPRPVPAPAPPAVQRPLPELPVTQVEEEVAKVVPRKLFTLSVRNADIREVLLAFAKQTDINLVVDPDIQGNVTVDLKRVTLEEALDALLSPLALAYRREGSLLRVARPAFETRIFTVNYISTVRTGGGTLSATAGGGTIGATTTGTTTAAGSTVGGTAAASSSVSSSDRVDLWDELEKTLKTFLSKDGTIILSRTSGLIGVTDFPVNIRRVAQYLELVQGSAQRQVMIEAQILEVTLAKDFSAGINWSLVAENLTIAPFGRVTGTLTGGALISQTLAPATSLFQIGLATKVGGQTLQAVLNALSQQGTVTILSSPKISTLNNQKAVMKVATDDVFFTVRREREPTTGVVTETTIPQIVTEGIVLDVTPQISEDDTVIMNVRPSISERIGQATSPGGSTVPIVSVRAADTVVRVKDGQTVVIGGLMQNRSTRNTAGVPLLQDVPVVGGLFRQRQDEDRKTELIILLTPTVLIGRRHSELTPQELQILRDTGRAQPRR